MTDLYADLGIERDADQDAIAAAHRAIGGLKNYSWEHTPPEGGMMHRGGPINADIVDAIYGRGPSYARFHEFGGTQRGFDWKP